MYYYLFLDLHHCLQWHCCITCCHNTFKSFHFALFMWQLLLICHFSSISQHQFCSLFLLHHFAIVFFSFFFIIFMQQLFTIHHCPQIYTSIVAPLFFGCLSMPLQLMQNQIHVIFLCDNIIIFTNFSHDVSNLFCGNFVAIILGYNYFQDLISLLSIWFHIISLSFYFLLPNSWSTELKLLIFL